MMRMVLYCMLVIISVGCSRFETEYGQFAGGTSESSINGLGMLRRSFENADWKTIKLSRLSERAATSDVIVWAPSDASTLYDDAREWFEEWLASGPHTLVYIVPDDGTELAYFDQARRVAAPEQQLEYRRRIAQLQTSQMLSHVHLIQSIESGWFILEPMPRNESLSTQPAEHWNVSSLTSKPPADTRFTLSGIQYQLEPLPAPASQASGTAVATSSSSSTTFHYKYNTTASEAADLELTPLLVSDQGAVLIAKATSSDWGESQVIVVSGGSLLCNYSLTKPINQELLAHLLQACGDGPGKLGYMSTGYGGANVKTVDQEISQTLGLETLTTWPLNVIMLNLALLGFIACMILLPIFGRPKRIVTRSSHDFADHLDAVAALMYKSGGESEARQRISDYMRRVRGEQNGPWVLAEIAIPIPSLQKAIEPLVLEPVSEPDGKPAGVSDPATEAAIATVNEPNQPPVSTDPHNPPLKDAT